MRTAMVMSLLVAGLVASPAAAAPAPQREPIRVPPELTDPEFIDRIAETTEALSEAMLSLPVGELEAAAEGREITDADRRRTVRDLGKLSDPDFERRVQQKIADARPQVQAAMQAFARALPAITKALSEAADRIERATANMPQPGYPRR